MALEHAGGDHRHERLDRRGHRVAHVVDDRSAVAAAGPRITAGGHVERDDQAGLLEQRPHRLERRDRCTAACRARSVPVDRRAAEAHAAVAVVGGPLDLAHRPVDVAGRRAAPSAGSTGSGRACTAEVVDSAQRLKARHIAIGEDRVGRGPAQQPGGREDELDVDAVECLVGDALLDACVRRSDRATSSSSIRSLAAGCARPARRSVASCTGLGRRRAASRAAVGCPR